MKVNTQKLPQCQLQLEVELEPAEMEAALEKAYRRLVNQIVIPGFRRGKAPRDVLEAYRGREMLVAEAIDQLLPKTYQQALSDNGIEPAAPPDIQIKQREPLAFTATVPLKPVVELGDYHSLRLSQDPVPVTEEDVAKALEELRLEQAPWEPVERPAQEGDLVTLDMESWLGDKPYLSQQGLQYRLPASFPLPGFSPQIVGSTSGEEKSFSLPHPQGEVRFQVKVLGIKGKSPLPLDEELGKTLGYSDLASLKEGVKQRLQAGAEQEARRQLEEKVVDTILAQSQVEFPPILVETRLERRLREAVGDKEKARQELRPQVELEVKRSLILGWVAEAEGLEVKDEEIDAEVERMAQGERGEALRSLFTHPAARDSLRDSILTKKTLDRLLEIASGKEKSHGGD